MERREWMAFAMGSLAGAGLAYVCINHWRETSRKATLGDAQLSSAMQDLDQQSKNRPGDFLEDEIVKEHLTRNIQFFGRESQLQISKSFVVVVGLGVSSYCNLGMFGDCFCGMMKILAGTKKCDLW